MRKTLFTSDGYMSDDEVKIFADGFMAAYDRKKNK